jgi:hypothetical protein
MDHEANKAAAKSRQILKGHLEIDLDNGVATFTSGGIRVLRITHLPDPIPKGMSIDVTAISQLTSYTPMHEVYIPNVQDYAAEYIIKVHNDDLRLPFWGPPSGKAITRQSRGTGDMKKGQW